MKTILLSIVLFFSGTILFSQQTHFVTNNSMIKIVGDKNGEGMEWENKDINITLDYETGKLVSFLENKDLINNSPDSEFSDNSIEEENEYTLEGIFPIEEIISQQQTNQNYEVELQLKNDDLNLSETILFNMAITRPESNTNESYRTFILSGTLYNDELNLPVFEEFDNEIELWLIFSGHMNAR